MLIFSIYEVESHISLDKRDGAKKTVMANCHYPKIRDIRDQAMIL